MAARGDRTLKVIHGSTERVVAERVRVASSFAGRLRGLMGQPSLPAGEGLYLPGTNSIHMLFMRFPIDCLFLRRKGEGHLHEVIAMRHSLRPWRGVVWYVRRARGVIELPVGTLNAAGVEVGDLVRLHPMD